MQKLIQTAHPKNRRRLVFEAAAPRSRRHSRTRCQGHLKGSVRLLSSLQAWQFREQGCCGLCSSEVLSRRGSANFGPRQVPLHLLQEITIPKIPITVDTGSAPFLLISEGPVEPSSTPEPSRDVYSYIMRCHINRMPGPSPWKP